MIKIGSLFAGIGGFELGLERAIPGAKTIWQVEQNPFCQKVLAKHWPDAKIYNDVRNITKDTVEPVDILCGGFPCQDISLAGKGEGLHGKKSGLWWEMLRIISELRPPIIVLENVAALLVRGGCEVVGSLAKIGYNSEWTIISARDFGAPHMRKRWFCVSYPTHSSSTRSEARLSKETTGQERKAEKLNYGSYRSNGRQGQSYWSTESGVRRVVNGIPNRAHRLRALGNAIVPQCSEWVGHQIVKSGLLGEFL